METNETDSDALMIEKKAENPGPKSKPCPKSKKKAIEPDHEPVKKGNSMEGKSAGLVTKLYKCPICQSKWLQKTQAQDHVADYHRIPVKLQSQFGVTFQEIAV